MYNKKRAGLLLISILTLATAPSLFAQEDEVPATEATPSPEIEVDEVDAQIAEITAAIEEIDRLNNLLDGAEPGYRDLMQRRVDDRESLVAQQVSALAEKVVGRESEDDFNQAHRDQAIGWLELTVPWVNRHLARKNADIVERLGKEASLSPSEAAASTIEIDRALSQSILAYEAFNRMLNDLESLGVDVTERRGEIISRLREAAAMLAVAIQMDSEQLQKLRFRLSVMPGDSDLQTLIRVVELKRSGFARNLSALSNLLKKLDVDPSEYRSLVLMVTGDVASRILDTGVMSTLAKQWTEAGWKWVKDNGLSVTIKIIVFLFILFIFRALSHLIRRAAERGVKRVNLSVLLRSMIVSTAGNVVMALGVMIALSQMGVSLGPLLAGLGVLGFIVGFALQDTLGNFASGMMILLYRPYDVGDVITAAGVTGKVKDMSLVYTMILTFDNQKMIVPNSKIWGDVIQNVTAQRVRRVDLVFGISYTDDIEKAEKVLADIIDEHELTLDDPEPMIKLHTLNESSVDFIVRPWVKSADYWDVYWDLTREVKMRFDKEGISIPYPQRDVHHHYDEPPPAPSKA